MTQKREGNLKKSFGMNLKKSFGIFSFLSFSSGHIFPHASSFLSFVLSVINPRYSKPVGETNVLWAGQRNMNELIKKEDSEV